MKQPPGLIIDCPETCADLVYASGFFAPDAVIFLAHAGRTTLVLNRLEIDRGRREARVNEVLPYESLSEPLKRKLKREPGLGEVAAALLQQRRLRRVRVPERFPLGLARVLEGHGVRVDAAEGAFFPERECKSADEVKALSRASRITEAGMLRGMEVLSQTVSGRGRVLRWGGKILTSERLCAEIDAAVLRAGGLPHNTIVAGGAQACDPHERGSGPLRAGELIILDIFPRDARSGYFGDMTRTVVKGRASDAQHALWLEVQRGQRYALQQMRPGQSGKVVEDEIRARFAAAGYPTEQREGRWSGFFHGTGHGLGLEIHESPRFARTVFKPGQVITVEPGLYIPEIGGVRLEDVALVTDQGCRVLSRFPQKLVVH